MAIETTLPRSRRALLAGGLGGLASLVATAIGRPDPARAGTDGDVVLGAANTATTTTAISNFTTANTAFSANCSNGHAVSGTSSAFGKSGVHGVSNVTDGRGVSGSAPGASGWLGGAHADGGNCGVYGECGAGSGVRGYSATGRGVDGYSDAGAGVYGESGMGPGVVGESFSEWGVYGGTANDDRPAILGTHHFWGTGVQGVSGEYGGPVDAPPMTGVHGYAAQDATAVGVRGTSTSGTGVLATATTGTALRVAGKATFSRSGRATVLKGRYYTDITVAGGLTSRSVVNATLQTYRAGVAIAAVRPNYPVIGKARIYLTKVASTTASTYVGWFVAEY